MYIVSSYHQCYKCCSNWSKDYQPVIKWKKVITFLNHFGPLINLDGAFATPVDAILNVVLNVLSAPSAKAGYRMPP